MSNLLDQLHVIAGKQTEGTQDAIANILITTEPGGETHFALMIDSMWIAPKKKNKWSREVAMSDEDSVEDFVRGIAQLAGTDIADDAQELFEDLKSLMPKKPIKCFVEVAVWQNGVTSAFVGWETAEEWDIRLPALVGMSTQQLRKKIKERHSPVDYIN